MLTNNQVAFSCTDITQYPDKVPFDPAENYPEYTGNAVDPSNLIYGRIRDHFRILGLDAANYGTAEWNPLGDLVKPGMTVFLKPNTVAHEHTEKKDVFSVINHASVLRPVMDYILIALKGQGRIIIGDSQLYSSDFDKAMDVSQVRNMLEWFGDHTKVPIECIDLRINRAVRTYLYGKWGRIPIMQDPRGYTFVDLGDASMFNGLDPKRLRIAIASYKNMIKHHSNGKHEYKFPGSFLASNAVISISKLKTHRRTAVTLALKNFMGLPAYKDSLPHFITGSPEEGGDQYINPSLRKRIVTRLHDTKEATPYIPVKFVCAIIKNLLWNSHKIIPFKDDIYEGMWYGNDTLWRTLLDLNRAALYADSSGKICMDQQRSYFGIIDGFIGGEKDGPLSPDPVPAGTLVSGFNPVAIDAVGAALMGFDVDKIPLIYRGLEDGGRKCPIFTGSIEDILAIDGHAEYTYSQLQSQKRHCFEPHPGWKGYCELSIDD